MQTSCDFLDAVKAKYGLESDYALAKRLAVGPSCIGNYRAKRSFLDDQMALKVAEALGIEWAYVAACANAERTKDAGMRAKFMIIAEKLGGVAATVLLGLAAYTLPLAHVTGGGAMCIM